MEVSLGWKLPDCDAVLQDSAPGEGIGSTSCPMDEGGDGRISVEQIQGGADVVVVVEIPAVADQYFLGVGWPIPL